MSDESRPLIPSRPARTTPEDIDKGPGSTLTGWPLFYVACSLSILMFVAGLETSLVIATGTKIASDLHSAQQATSLGTAYLLASSISAPIQARMSNNFGRTPIIVSAAVAFTIGAFLCGLAPSMPLLLFARFITGAGSGGIMIMSSIILSESVPHNTRAFWHSVGHFVGGSAAALGAPLGGMLTDQIGWRSTFLALVPLSVFATLFASCFLIWACPLPDFSLSSIMTALDVGVLEMLVMASSLCSFLACLSALPIVISKVPDLRYSAYLCAAFAVTLLLFYVLLRIERRLETPILDLRRVSSPDIGPICAINFLASTSYQGALYTTPYFLTVVRHTTATSTGLQLLPVSAIASLCSILCGVIVARVGKVRTFLAIGGILPLFGFLCLVFATMVDKDELFAYFAECGGLLATALGQQVISALTMVALLGVCRKEHLASGTSLVSLSKSVGGVCGTIFSGLIIQTSLTALLDRDIGGPDKEKIIWIITSSVDRIGELPGTTQDIAHMAWTHSFRLTFFMFACTAMLSLPLTLVVRLADRSSTRASRTDA